MEHPRPNAPAYYYVRLSIINIELSKRAYGKHSIRTFLETELANFSKEQKV